MIKNQLLCVGFMFSGLSYAISYQEQTSLTTSSLHPIDRVCKTSFRNSSYTKITGITPGYAVVGEIQDDSCSGGGKNAWLTKPLEPKDTICSAPHISLLYLDRLHISNFGDSIAMKNYTIIGRGNSDKCPLAYDAQGNRSLYNTVTLDMIDNPTFVCYGELSLYKFTTQWTSSVVQRESCKATDAYKYPIGYYLQLPNSAVIENCISGPMSGRLNGYLNSPQYYTAACDGRDENVKNNPNISNPRTTQTSYIPYDGSTYSISSTSENRAYIPNIVAVENVNSLMTNFQKVSRGESIDICSNSYTVPEGYRIVGMQYTDTCASIDTKTLVRTSQAQYKIVLFNKPMAAGETRVFCSTTVYNQKPRHYDNVPNGYVLTRTLHSPACYFAQPNQINAYEVRKLANIDTVCKSQWGSGNRMIKSYSSSNSPIYEDDYGIIGQATLEACGSTVNNAWQIKKLATVDTVCSVGFNANSYPDYVIASMTHLASCSGVGNNAYHIRPVNEPEDIVCEVPYASIYVLQAQGFERVSNESKSECGTLKAGRYRLKPLVELYQ